MVFGHSKFPLETKFPRFLPIFDFDLIRFPRIPTNRNASSLSQNTRDSLLHQPLLVPLQEVVYAALRPRHQLRQFSYRHTLAVACDYLVAFVSKPHISLILYSLATARASRRKTVGDSALQAVANTLRHLGSRSQVVDDVEHPPPEPTHQSHPTRRTIPERLKHKPINSLLCLASIILLLRLPVRFRQPLLQV